MNENYIPEEEAAVTPPLPEENDIPAESQVEPAEAIETEAPAASAEELPDKETPVVETVTEEAPANEEAVTEIILETLAEQESDTAATMVLPPMNEEQTEALIDESAQEYSAPTALPQEQFDDGGAFQQMFEKKAEEPEIEKKERPVRKGRPKRPSGYGLLSIPHMLAAVIWLLIIVAIGTTLGRMIWVCAADVLAFGRESKEVSISITADDTMETIADKLHDAGLINIPELFLLYADLADVEEEHKITTGTFTLNTI